jgi:hypothetical protein
MFPPVGGIAGGCSSASTFTKRPVEEVEAVQQISVSTPGSMIDSYIVHG